MKRFYDTLGEEVVVDCRKRQKFDDDDCRITVESWSRSSFPSSCVLVINEVTSAQVLGFEKSPLSSPDCATAPGASPTVENPLSCPQSVPGCEKSLASPAVDNSSSSLESSSSFGSTPSSSTSSSLSTSTSSASSPSSSIPIPPPAAPKDAIPRVSRRHLSLGEFLGQGLFGKVYKGVLRRDQKEPRDVVVKMSKTRGFTSFQREAQTLLELDGAGGTPRLIGLTHEDPEALVMEYCPGALLSSYLKDNPPKDDSSLGQCMEILEELGKQLQHFHAKGFAHMDLHTGNILVDMGEDRVSVRIIDVGLSRRLHDNERKSDLLERDRRSLSKIENRVYEEYLLSLVDNDSSPLECLLNEKSEK